jgi:hypothetical protein
VSKCRCHREIIARPPTRRCRRPWRTCARGFPLSEKQARNLDTLLKALPKSKEFEYRKTVFLKAPTELNPGERSDVSWISTETPDRYDHVVFAKGT